MHRTSIVPPLAVALIAIVFASAIGPVSTCLAGTFKAGDFITYTQSSWGDPASQAGTLLAAQYNSVYASTFGILEAGIPGAAGFSMRFSSPLTTLAYLPGVGPSGQLTGDLLDPIQSPSGVFGGAVLGLKLNIDFADAGHTLGNLGVPFGDLVIHSYHSMPAVNGQTVRGFLAKANTLLGGGFLIGYSISDAHLLCEQLNACFFAGGSVSEFAQNNLMLPATPTCFGDINQSGSVNVSDLLAVIGAWGSCVNPNDCPADIAPPPNGNDIVNVSDLLAVVGAWGPCP
jgi:hypothetical protein